MRFPGFTDEWKETTIGDVAKIEKGNGISKTQLSDEGEECILYGELYTKYKSEIIDEVYSKTGIDSTKLTRSHVNDVIIPCSGESAEDIATARCVKKDGILLGGDLNIIRFDRQDGSFMSYQLNGKRKYDIARVAQGVSVVHLYPDHLKSVKIYLPQLEEQQTIVTLLSLIDERIATQTKIIEDLKKLKSAIYDKVFQTLKGELCLLGDVADIMKGKQINGELLTEVGDYYVMNGGVEPSGYYHDFNVSHNTISISEGGNSCGYIQWNSAPFWSGGHCYTLRIKKSIMENKYLYHFLKWHENDIMRLRIGSGLPNIQKKDLANVTILIPKTSVQNQIIHLMDSIDERIEVESKVSLVFLRQKTYLLSQMFI